MGSGKRLRTVILLFVDIVAIFMAYMFSFSKFEKGLSLTSVPGVLGKDRGFKLDKVSI